MNLTRRFGSGRGRLSLRSRLLAGLITVTALFLIIMGVVTTVVLGNSEQEQFNSDLSLTARIKLTEVADLTGGYAVIYLNVPTRKVGVLSPPSAATAELQALIDGLLASPVPEAQASALELIARLGPLPGDADRSAAIEARLTTDLGVVRAAAVRPLPPRAPASC